MIVATGRNNEIGRNNELMWHLPDDFRWFVKQTKHKTIVMGRNTMDSLGNPLKNRRNIVLSSKNTDIIDGFEHFTDLESVFSALPEQEEELMIIGGAQLYRYALKFADRLYITRVDAAFDDADTFFPVLDSAQWELTYKEVHERDETHQYGFEFQILERRK
jgi:dihydrofolate reductase